MSKRKFTRSIDGAMRTTVRVSFRFDAETFARLDRLSKLTGQPVSTILHRGGQDFVDWRLEEELELEESLHTQDQKGGGDGI